MSTMENYLLMGNKLKLGGGQVYDDSSGQLSLKLN
jgi:hypothetical protein